MSAQTTPIGTVSTDHRGDMVFRYLGSLQDLIYQAMGIPGTKSDDIVAFCIQVDSQWKDIIVDKLAPDANWQQYRDAGREPVVRVVTSISFCDYLAKAFPMIAGDLQRKPQEGNVKCVVLDEDGCTMCEIGFVFQKE